MCVVRSGSPCAAEESGGVESHGEGLSGTLHTRVWNAGGGGEGGGQVLPSPEGLVMGLDGSCGQGSHWLIKEWEHDNDIRVSSHWGRSENSGQALGDIEQGAQLRCPDTVQERGNRVGSLEKRMGGRGKERREKLERQPGWPWQMGH